MSRSSNLRRPLPRPPVLRPLCLALALAGIHGASLALPETPKVTQGTVVVQTPAQNVMTLTQSTQKAVVEWQRFSISVNEQLKIVQPNARSVLLNRVVGQDPSLILGQLTANGRVFLSNPRGILFGQNAQVDVGGLLATTLDISGQDASGRWQLSTPSGSTPGAIEVDGRLNAPNGTLAVVAPQVTVRGQMLGQRVGVAAASRALVDVEGDGLIFFDVGNDGLDARLEMLGTLQADGGTVDMRAQARAGFADTVLNMDGLVRARSIGQRDGQVVIDGGSAGVVRVSGQVNATGLRAGEHGGQIELLGEKVGLVGEARLDASGDSGGGVVLVGGGFQGHGLAHNAQQVFVGSGVRLHADAVERGDGGQVVVWSDQTTRYFGQLSARGGAQGGNGGLAEVSGKGFLDFQGGADLGAARGARGQLWLDPLNLTIGTVADADGAGNGDDIGDAGIGDNILFGDFPGQTSNVTAAQLNSLLATTDVTLQATQDVTVQTAVNAPAGTGSLTLDAGRNLIVSQNVAVGGSLTLRADSAFAGGSDGTGTLTVANGRTLSSTSGQITLSGAAMTFSGANSVSAGTDIEITSTGGAVALPTTNAGGNLTVSAGGNITQTGVITTGTSGSSFTVDSGRSVNLSTQANSLAGAGTAGGVTFTDATDIAFRNVGSIQLGATTAAGQIDLTSDSGSITDGGVLSVGANGSSFTTSTAGQSISLGTSTHVLGGRTVSFQTSGAAGNVALKADDITLAASSIGGNLTATSTTGGIDQTGVITTGATGSSFAVASGQSVNLATQANSFAGAGTAGGVTFTNATDIGFRNVGSIQLGATTAAGQIDLTSDSGSITDGGVLTVGANGSSFTTSTAGQSISLATSTHALGGRTVAFQTSGTAGNVALQADDITLAASTIGGNLVATATTGNIDQSGAISLGAAGSSFTTSANNALVTLDNASNGLANTTLAFSTTGSGADVTLDGNTLVLAASTIGGKLVATAASGSISQTGVITTGATGSSFEVASGQSVNLATQANSFTGAGTAGGVTFTNATDIGFRNVGSIELGATTAAGQIDLTSDSGSITDGGVLTVGANGSSFTTSTAGQSISLATSTHALGGRTVAFQTSGATGNVDFQADSFSLAASSIGNNLVATATTGTITQSGALSLGGSASSFTTSTANRSITLTNAGNVFGSSTLAFSTSGSTGNVAVTGDALNLAASTIGGSLTATASSGDIVQSGALSLGATGSSFTTTNTGSSITLNNAGNSFASTTLALNTTGTAGNATVSADTLSLGTSSIGGNLSATSTTGGIDQTGVITTGATGSSFAVASGQSVNLATQANSFAGAGTAGGVTFTNATDIAFRNVGGIQLGATTAAGQIDLTSDSGSITDGGVLTVGANGSSFTTSTAGQSISLATSTHALGGRTVAFQTSGTAGNVALQADDITLAASTIGGNLVATATTGNIDQSGAISLGAAGSSFTTSAADATINLSDSGNSFTNTTLALNTSGSAGDATVTGNALAFAATTLGGKLAATATTGNITQTGAMSLGAAGSSFTTSASNSSITLANTGNLFASTTLALSTSGSAGDATITGDTLDFAASTVGGKLIATAITGGISQTGAISTGASGSSFTVSSGQSIDFSTQANTFAGAGSAGGLSFTGATDIALRNVGDIQLAATTAAGQIDLISDSGSITDGGVLTVGADGSSFTTSTAGQSINLGTSTHALGGRTVAFQTSGAAGDVALKADDITLAASTVGGKLQATATTGNIDQTGALAMGAVGSSFTTSTAGSTVTLADTANSFANTTLALNTSGSTGDATVTGDTLSFAASNVGGKLTATSLTGGIGQTGVIALGADGSQFTAAAGQSISLSGQANLFGSSTVGFSTSSGGSVAVRSDSLNLSATQAAGDFTAQLDGGSLSQTGPLEVGGTATLQAGSGTVAVTLADAANQLQDVQLQSTGGTLGAVSLRTAGAQTVAGDATTLTLDAGAALVLAGGSYTSLAATARGGITQTGAVSVSGIATLSTDAAGTTVQLDDADNEWHQLDLSATGAGTFDSVVLVDKDQVRVDGLRFGGNAGSVQLDAGGTLQFSGSNLTSLAATSTGSVTQTGALQVAGTSTFTARGTGIDLTLANAANSLPSVLLAITGTGSWNQVSLRTLGAQSFAGNAASASLTTGGGLALGGGQYGSFTALVGGPVSQTGALSVSGLASFTAQAAGVTVALDGAGSGNELNQVTLQNGTGTFGTVRVTDADATRPDGLTVSGQAAALDARSSGNVQLGAGQWGQLNVDTSSGPGAITQTAALVVSGDTVLNAGTGSITLARTDNQFNSVAVLAASTASLADSDGFSLGDSVVSGNLALASAGTIAITGQVSGTASVTKSGSGTLAVTSEQLWSGGTQLVGGTLSVSGASASIGTGDLQLGAGTVLALGPDTALANDLQSQGATLRQVAGSAVLSGDITLGATSTLEVASGAQLDLQGDISGTATGLTKTGLGSAVLSGTNTTTGLSTVAQGTLLAAASGSLSGAAALQVDAAGTLALAADATAGSLAGSGQVALGTSSLTVGTDQSSTLFTGQISGAGGLTKTGSGTLTLGGNNLYTGATLVAAGTLATTAGQRIADGSALTVDRGATLRLGGDETLGSVAGAGQLALAGHRLTAGGDGSDTEFSGQMTGAGAFTKAGGGSLTLSGANLLAGTTQVDEGQLRITNPAALPTGSALQVAGDAEVLMQADLALGSLTGTGTVVLEGTQLGVGVGGASSRFDGALTGDGTLLKTGNGTASWGGTSDFTGTAQVAAGTLLIDGSFTGLPRLVVAPAGTLTLGADQRFGSVQGSGFITLGSNTLRTGANNADTLYSGVISGSGRLVKQGSGTFTLSGTNTFAGGTTIEDGTLQLGDGGAQGDAGTGAILNDSLLRVVRAGELRLDAPVTGSGALDLLQGTLTLGSTGNDWTGDTRVLGGLLQTTGAERLPDATALSVASGASLLLAGSEQLGSLDAQGGVTALGSIFTTGAQAYAGGLTLQGGVDATLSGTAIEAGTELNNLGTGRISVSAGTVNLRSAAAGGGTHEALTLGEITVSGDSEIVAGRLTLDGAVTVNGGALALTADAAPDPAKLTALGTAQVPGTALPVAFWEDTVLQNDTSAITVAAGASLQVNATGGGSINLLQDANLFLGTFSALSGPAFNTAWSAQTVGALAPVTRVQVAGDQVRIGGSGVEADTVYVRANHLETVDGATLTARLPFDNLVLGSNLSIPSMVLELSPDAFATSFPFGESDNTINVVVGARVTGGRTTGPDGGFLTVLPKNGASGSTAVFLSGPLVSGGYSFFHDGAGKQNEIPVFYNGSLPKSPQLAGSLAAVAAVSEAARKDRFEEAVRTENVTVRLRSGVIAEVGPGRPATVGSEGAATPALCEPQSNSLQCRQTP